MFRGKFFPCVSLHPSLCFRFVFFLIRNSKEIALVQGQTSYAFSFHVRLLRRNGKAWILWRSHILGKHRIPYTFETNIARGKVSYHDLGHKTLGWEKRFPL